MHRIAGFPGSLYGTPIRLRFEHSAVAPSHSSHKKSVVWCVGPASSSIPVLGCPGLCGENLGEGWWVASACQFKRAPFFLLGLFMPAHQSCITCCLISGKKRRAGRSEFAKETQPGCEHARRRASISLALHFQDMRVPALDRSLWMPSRPRLGAVRGVKVSKAIFYFFFVLISSILFIILISAMDTKYQAEAQIHAIENCPIKDPPCVALLSKKKKKKSP